MTLEKVFTAEAKDIRSVQLVCKSCGSLQGYKPLTWKGSLIYSCSNCSSANKWPESSNRRQVESLIASLQKLSEDSDDLPFEIRLQFESVLEK